MPDDDTPTGDEPEAELVNVEDDNPAPKDLNEDPGHPQVPGQPATS